MAIRLVVFGLLSLRGVTRTLRLFDKWFNGGTPCHVVIQNWVLRFGLYKLLQATENRRDWVYILDHTIEFGTKKCLVVLGLPLSIFRINNCKIRHSDMDVLAISIVEKATAQSVTKVLHDISQVAGIPVQILSDNGSSIRCGIRDFIKEAKCDFTIRQTYDVTHQAAVIFKHHLEKDKNWASFTDLICQTKRGIIQTAIGFMAPPKPRDKARWLNLDAYVEWAECILCLGEKGVGKIERNKFTETLSWVRMFEDNIIEWRTMLDLLTRLKDEVKSNGLSKNTKDNFENSILELNLNTQRLMKIKEEVLDYLERECDGMSEVYPGCSDIIESVFGKYKTFSANSPMKEIGKAVLTIPVFTSNVGYRDVRTAMETVSAHDVKIWLDENIGESLFAKRKRVFSLKRTRNNMNKFPEKLKKAASF